jgi:hypothetical protein
MSLPLDRLPDLTPTMAPDSLIGRPSVVGCAS